jgi:hypothetical protein
MYHAFFVSMTYRDSALAAAQRALELNPELDEAHFVTGDLLLLSGRPADRSDAEATTGRLDESLYWALRGLALYPRSKALFHHVSVPLGLLGDDAATPR